MEKKSKILAPTDISELSKIGLRRAIEMAAAQNAELIVYHVIGYAEIDVHDEAFYSESLAELLLKERKKLLDIFLRENFADILPKISIRQEVEVGVVYRRIVEKAVEEGAELIVMSTHGRTGLLHMLIGSVTEKVVQRATCPVLSIRPVEEARIPQAAAL